MVGVRFALVLFLCAVPTFSKEYKGKPVAVKQPPYSQLRDREGTRPVGKSLRVGRSKIKTRLKDGQLYIGKTPGGGAVTKVKAGKAVTVRAGGKPHKLAFVRDASGAWRYYAPQAWDYKIGQSKVRLVDLDGDGKYTLAADGYLAHGCFVACPLDKVLWWGTERVEIDSIRADGSRLKATVKILEGGKAQLAALADLNRRRARHGIAPVSLDAALSRACTAHAEYLVANNWTGLTNPHSQTLGPKGATAEGESAAQRSVITAQSPADSILGFWKTYYHRGPLIDPLLRRVGINANERFAVVDIRSGVDRKSGGRWRDEVFVPADGSVGLMTGASREMPKDPVPAMETRGNPIQVHIRDAPKISGFTGSLRTDKRDKDVPVFVVPRAESMFGLVPKAPLEAATWYRATFSYNRDGKTTTRVIRFRTE